MATFKKDPNATLDYTFDWGQYLEPMLDTISSVTWIVSDNMTVVSQSNTTTTASVFLSGGLVGTDEKVICRITTLGGRVDDRSITIKIVER